MKSLFSLLFVFFSLSLSGQYLVSMHTQWDDTFREWNVILAENDSTTIEGDIDIIWDLNNDFTSYTFRIGEHYGEIRQVFKNKDNHWELRMLDEVVNIRKVWFDDPREWTIKTDTFSFRIKSKYGNVLDDWTITDSPHGEYEMYSEVIGDARDWTIEDYLADDVPLSVRLALAFVVVHASSPKL